MTNPLPSGWLGPLLSLLVALGSVAAAWTTLAVDNADTKRRVTFVEQRQAEDRTEARHEQREIKADVKQIGSDVQIILRKLDAIEAAQKALASREPPSRWRN